MWLSDNSINPLGASGTTAPAPSTSVRAGVGGVSLGRPLAPRAHPWGGWVLKHGANTNTGEKVACPQFEEKDTEVQGSPSSCLPFPR